MNVLFVHSETWSKRIGPFDKKRPLGSQDEIQFGISYISSLLKKHGHGTRLFIAAGRLEKKKIDKAVNDFKPGLICFTAVFREFNMITLAAKYIKKKYPAIYLLAGGAHITLNPEQAINEAFDAICVGEGEYPARELIEQLEKKQRPSKINNLWIKSENGIERNITRNFLPDLDRLPFPDRQMWQRWIKRLHTSQVILLGRGCPFTCSYCCNHAFKKVAPGKYVRFRSPGNIIAEITELLIQFPETKTVYFETEALNADEKYLFEFCHRLEEFNKSIGNRLSYGVNLRITPNTDMKTVLFHLRKAGIGYISIGLESGNEMIREKILDRHYSNRLFKEVVKTAKRYRLFVMVYAMIGIPGETKKEYLDTVNILRECKPHYIQVNIFFPYPGTKLYRHCLEQNHLPKNRLCDRGRNAAVLDLPGFSKKEIQESFYDFLPRVYSKNKVNYYFLKWFSYLIQKWNLFFLTKIVSRFLKYR